MKRAYLVIRSIHEDEYQDKVIIKAFFDKAKALDHKDLLIRYRQKAIAFKTKLSSLPDFQSPEFTEPKPGKDKKYHAECAILFSHPNAEVRKAAHKNWKDYCDRFDKEFLAPWNVRFDNYLRERTELREKFYAKKFEQAVREFFSTEDEDKEKILEIYHQGYNAMYSSYDVKEIEIEE